MTRRSSPRSHQLALTAWGLLALLAGAQAAAALTAQGPSAAAATILSAQQQQQQGATPGEPQAQARKYAEKSNALKKVSHDNDLDDVSTNSIQASGEGFSWSSMLSTVMQLLFSPQPTAPLKSDGLESDGLYQSPWTNLLSMGLKILSAFISGGASTGGDGIDKVDNGSPMQFINIVVNLLDALKTSFSHRYMEARAIGRKDSVAEAAVAGLTMLKGTVRTMRVSQDACSQRLMCDASRECAEAASPNQPALFCQMSAYMASFVLERLGNGAPFAEYYEATRRGRSGGDCRQAYLSCNEA